MSQPLHVLIVEDRPEDSEIICRALRDGGYDPIAERVDTAGQMVAALDRKEWDLIIADHFMPRFDAPQALRLLQASGKDVPFIIVSGSINEEIAVSAMRAGARDFVMKDRLTRLVPAVTRELREAQVRHQRRRAEQELREVESRYQDLYENAPDMCGSIDWATHRMVQCNNTLERMTGFSKEEILGRPVFELHPADCRQRIEEVLRHFQSAGEIRDAEVSLLRKDGSTIDVSMNVTALRNERGHILRGRCVWRDITDRKRAERKLQEQAERLQILSRRLLDAQETERRAVARELHDEIGQVLTAVKLNLQSLDRAPAAAAASSPTSDLHESIDIVEHAIQLVRDRSMDLRPALLDDFGLVPAIRWYLDRHARRAGFKVHLRADPLMQRHPSQIETACFRVIQEAVTNAMRHSKATVLDIAIETHSSGLRFVICDDGAGFDVDAAKSRALAGGSIGLAGMQERVEFLNGTLEIDSSRGGGTRIEVFLPSAPAAGGEINLHGD